MIPVATPPPQMHRPLRPLREKKEKAVLVQLGPARDKKRKGLRVQIQVKIQSLLVILTPLTLILMLKRPATIKAAEQP